MEDEWGGGHPRLRESSLNGPRKLAKREIVGRARSAVWAMCGRLVDMVIGGEGWAECLNKHGPDMQARLGDGDESETHACNEDVVTN